MTPLTISVSLLSLLDRAVLLLVICTIFLIIHNDGLGCSWCTDSCLNAYTSEGWQLVRGVGPTHNAWHPANDELAGTAIYNTANTYSVNFESIVPNFNQFLFISGDCSIWLITSKQEAIGETYDTSNPRWICSSSRQTAPYLAAWTNRGNAEDPWIGTVSHGTSVYATEMLYGESNSGSYTASITNNGGVNVYIRKVSGYDDRGCIGSGCTWCTHSCLNAYISDGWQLVRSVGPTHIGWHPANDELAGTAIYNGPDTYSVDFESTVPYFNQFLFITGDCSIWLITSKQQAIGEEYDTSNPRWICSSSRQVVSYQAGWANRGNAEDPWISTVTHGTSVYSTEMLYGESSSTSYTASITNNGGVNVYIRKVSGLDGIGCIYPCDTMNCNDNDLCTNDNCDASSGIAICVHQQIDCNDNNQCTDDWCSNGQCIHTPVICDDNLFCTDDACIDDECIFTPKDCDNGNLCQMSQCIETMEGCIYEDKCIEDGEFCDANTGVCAPIDCLALAIDEYLIHCSLEFTENENELSNIETKITDIVNDIQSNDDDILAINVRLDINDDNIASINAAISNHNIDINNINTEIAGIDTQINDLNVANSNNAAEIDGIDTNINAINTNIADINNQITNNEQDITNINTDIGNINTNIDVINTNIAQIATNVAAHDVDIDTMTTRIDNIDTNIVGINTAITNHDGDIADNEQLIDNLKIRVDNIDTDIVDININIASNTDSINNILERIHDFGNPQSAKSVIGTSIINDNQYKDGLIIFLLITNVLMMMVLILFCYKISNNKAYEKVITTYSSDDEQNNLIKN